MRTVQLMSMMKLILPPVVSNGQYQIMESSIAMVEHIAMTDRAMIGPQWNNLRTSWRFSNVTKADRKFMLFCFSLWELVQVSWLLNSWNKLTQLKCATSFLCCLSKSVVHRMHRLFLVFWVSSSYLGLESHGLSVSKWSLLWRRAASSPANLWSTLSLWET